MARKQHNWAIFTNWINSVAISDDGSRVVAGTYFPQSTNPNRTYGTYVYDENGQRLFADEYNGDRGIYSVAVSADGNFAASGGVRRDNGSGLVGLIRAFDLTTQTRILNFTNFNSRANSVAMSQDGSVLVAAAKSLFLFQRNGGGFGNPPTIFSLAGSESDSICVDPNGQWFAAGAQDGKVHLCKKNGGGVFQQSTFVTPAAGTANPQIRCVAASANGFLAAGGENGVVYVFNVNAFGGGPVAQINLTNGAQRFDVRLVGISANAGLVVASTNQNQPGVDTGRVFALNFNSGASTLTRKWDRQTTFGANGVSVDRSGNFVAASDGQPFNGNHTLTPGTFYLFRGNNGDPVWDFGTSLMNWPIAVSGDGQAVATGGDDGTIHYFDTNP